MRTALVLSMFLIAPISVGCGSPSSGGPADASVDAATTDGVHGLVLMTRLAGLWTGPATQTRLGDFPMMNVDFRGATEHLLFGRVDLDGANSLRMAFDVETIDGTDVLVFRNGGLFSGLSRDTRTVLVGADEAAGVYRFCATEAEGGCGYTDATWTFTGEEHVVLFVQVRGMPHLRWAARRAEVRELPSPFPATNEPVGTGSEPFPPMPSLEVSVSWSTPLPAAADVWLILATTPCASGTCVPSRWFRASAEAGATSAVLTLDQVHGGAYRGTAILDRDGNVASTLRPGPGDGVSVPDTAITVGASGPSRSALAIVVDL